MSDDNREEGGGTTAAAETTAEPPKTLAEGIAADPQSGDTTGEKPTDPPAAETKTETSKEAPQTAWPDDWRDKMAGGDDKLKNLLGRYTSPDALAKAFKELRAAYDSRKPATDIELPKNPTPEQLAEYRKAKDIPEKPEDYEFTVPEGKELGDGEYEIFMDFAKAMHEKNMPKSTVKDISGWFLDYQETVAQKNADLAYQNRVKTEEELRAEWGGDYRANVNLMSNILQEHLGSEAPAFLKAQLTDGSRIGDNKTFIKLMAELARKVGGSTAELYTTDVATTGKSLETRKGELMKMMNDPDPIVRKKYWSPEIQDELMRIQTTLTRRGG